MENKLRIKVENFNFYYDKFQALKDINLEIQENKVTALIGPSGCGKSTFLRSINRMNDLIDGVRYEGVIAFDGKSINRMNDLIDGVRYEGVIAFDGKNIFDSDNDIVELRKKIGMVFQKPNPFPKTIYENIVYGPKLHGEKDKKVLDEIVIKSLKAVALWDEVKDKLHQSALGLSGGQQQRLCIAGRGKR